NLTIAESYKLIPKIGVYAVKSVLKGQTVQGMMNIGYNPTIPGSGTERTIEIHFFDFDQDLYDQKILIDILEWIREEEKFDSLQDLKAQLQNDKLTVLARI